MEIKLADVRLLYGAALFTPQRGPNGEGELKFQATFGFPPSHPVVAAIKAAFQKVATDKWGAKAGETYAVMKAADKLCLRDGAAKGDKEGFAGNLFVSASNKTKPLVVGADPKVLLDVTSGKPYSGCYVNALIDLWPQDNKWGKRINASLKGVQFLRDGARLSGGGVASADDFEAIPEAGGGATAAPAAAGGTAPNPFD